MADATAMATDTATSKAAAAPANCANCTAVAEYYVSPAFANPLYYCGRCLPDNLTAEAAAGKFPLP